MSASFVQEDFGGFNPRFPGVTIKFASSNAFDEFQNFILNSSVPNDRPDLGVVAVRSVLDHEIRHYHDFLISPYGAMIFRLHLQALVNGASALHLIKNLAGHHVPIPISRWVQLRDREREEQKGEWRETLKLSGKGCHDFVALPYFSNEDFKKELPLGVWQGRKLNPDVFLKRVVEAACRSYVRMEELTAGFAKESELPELTPYNLAEVLGLAAQSQSIWNGQGQEAAEVFLAAVDELQLPYAQLWKRLWSFVINLEEAIQVKSPGAQLPRIDQIAAIASWCLLGNYQIDGTNACPAVRFLKLARHLVSAHSVSDIATNVARTWDNWDRGAGVTPWRKALQETLATSARGVQLYEKLVNEESAPEQVAQVMKRYAIDQRRVINHLLSHPDDIVHMNSYCNLPRGTLPDPLVRIELDGIGFPVDSLKDTAFMPVWTLGEKSQELATKVVLRLAADVEERLSEAIAFEDLMLSCDLVFSNHELPGDMQMYARREVERFLGKRLVALI